MISENYITIESPVILHSELKTKRVNRLELLLGDAGLHIGSLAPIGRGSRKQLASLGRIGFQFLGSNLSCESIEGHKLARNN
jgi:hypothetical protein